MLALFCVDLIHLHGITRHRAQSSLSLSVSLSLPLSESSLLSLCLFLIVSLAFRYPGRCGAAILLIVLASTEINDCIIIASSTCVPVITSLSHKNKRCVLSC